MIVPQQSNSLTAVFLAIVCRDLAIAHRHLNAVFHPVLFFIITVSLFPLAISPEPMFLQKLAPGIIWVAALLATLLALDGIFRSEYEDGTLELLALCPHPLFILATAKVCAHWLITGLPLIVIALGLGMMLNLPASAFSAMLLSLLLGTPTMSMIGAIGAALTVGARKSGALLALIVLPLYVPVLIFGASAIQAAAAQTNWAGQIYFLAAILMLCLTLAPFAIAAALRISLN
ncbi:heme exporter protein CcmB [Candidatus Spongiihabitans sp.]|uniref:heme exporter protein CcmB n=1 Tax=Candidatus Spongiihabitans sp. TaxID=3101308 RepID=UPI003C7E457B